MSTSQNYKILYPRGSEWRKWDLHIHSPLSILSNHYPKLPNGDPDWEAFISKLESLGDIAVIGITDYFTIDGYKKLMEFKRQGRLGNIYTILPNIEFRLNCVISSKKDGQKLRRLNFHVIFSNEVSEQDIEEHFLHDLHFFYEGNPQDKDDTRKLKPSNIQELGTKLISQHKKFEDSGLSPLQIGAIQTVVNHEDITECLEGSRFKGQYFLVFPEELSNLIDWDGQDHHTRKGLLQKCDMVFSSNDKTRAWCLGQEPYTEGVEKFFEEFKTRKPCIHGSDAHKIDEIGLPCAFRGAKGHKCEAGGPGCDLRYCWIKADPTFEGLKQLTHEPKERVYIGKSPPKSKTDAKVIDRIEISHSNNWFEETPLVLNDNLVAIIGEKGAGKTALADFIALAAGNFDKDEDPGSFVFKALKSSKQIQETIANCAIAIYWRDGSSDPVTIREGLGDYKELEKVRYLSQSFIEKKCRPEQAGELQNEVENIIFQYIPVQDRMDQTTFIDLKNKKSQSIQLKKARCEQGIIDLNIEIFNLEEEISSLGAKKHEKNKLQTEIKQFQKQKPKPTTEEEEKIEAKLSLLNNQRSQLDGQIAASKTQLNTIETIKTKVENLQTYVGRQLADITSDLKSVNLANISDQIKLTVPLDFNEALDNRKKEIQTQIQGLQGVDEPKKPIRWDITKESVDVDLNILTADYISKLSLKKINNLISKLESKSSLAEDKRKTIRAFEETIETHQKRVNELTSNIKQIEDIKRPLLPEKIKERVEAYKNYFILLQEEKNILEELYAPLREKLNKEDIGEKNQIEFFARIEFDVEIFFNKADDVIDFSKTGSYYRKRDLLFKEIKSISEKIELAETSDVYSLIAQLYKTFEEDKNKPIAIKKQLLGRKKKLDFYNWIFGVSDFSVTYSIKYQGTNIELLSPGKKGIVLLLMYLVLDTKSTIPLIIDQPEENLDNKSVYPYLINYFRAAKKRRQIIVISHNPNLVLNTDAEQIIVANFEAMPTTQSSRIRYISGAIENSFISEQAKIPIERQGIKEHGIDILEGGPEAFGKREDRYDIKRLKK